MEKLIQWAACNQDWITLVIAVFGAVLSAWNWIEKHLENRKRVAVEVKNVFALDQRLKPVDIRKCSICISSTNLESR